MSNERITNLKRIVEQSEDQPFPFYALGIEYKNIGDLVNSKIFFEETLKRFPEYVPTYYHYAQLLEALGDIAQARSAYEAGIECAKQAHDEHACTELEGALALLGEI